MSQPRVHIPGEYPAHGLLEVPADQAHHLLHVLRLAPGARITVFDGQGSEYAAVIVRAAKSGVTLELGEPMAVDRESPLAVTLAQGISSGERMDYTVQKAVELGVHAIQPLALERSVVRLSGERAEKRLGHWRKVAVAACEQCGRNILPTVLPVASLTSWLAAAPRDALRLTLSPGAASTLKALARPTARVLLLVGAEGGLSPREQADAQAAGFAPVRLGPRVLRTETAAVAALAAMQLLWGDF